MRLVLPLCLLALAACAERPGPVHSASAQPNGEKKVCRRFGTDTGSAVPARPVCRTRAQWAEIDEAHARRADQTLHGSSGSKYRPGS